METQNENIHETQKIFYPLGLVHTLHLRLPLLQTLRMGSMTINDGGSYLTFAFDGKDQRKTQTQTLSVNKGLAVG